MARSMWIYWMFLFAAVVFEVIGTSVMKLSQSGAWWLAPGPGLAVMLAFIVLSYYCLALSVQGLPVGVAYAFWEGLGLTLITVVSVFALGESMSPARLGALAAILAGALLINHGTGHGGGHGPARGHSGSPDSGASDGRRP